MTQPIWVPPIFNYPGVLVNGTFNQPTMYPWELVTANGGAASISYHSSGWSTNPTYGWVDITVTNGGSGLSDVRLQQSKDMFGENNVRIKSGVTYIMLAFVKSSVGNKDIRLNLKDLVEGSEYEAQNSSWTVDSWSYMMATFAPTKTMRNGCVRLLMGGSTGVVGFTYVSLMMNGSGAASDQLKDLIDNMIQRLGERGRDFNVTGVQSPFSDYKKIKISTGRMVNVDTGQTGGWADQTLTTPYHTQRKTWKYGIVYLNQAEGWAGIAAGEGVQYPEEPVTPQIPTNVPAAVPLALVRLLPLHWGIRGPDITDVRNLFRLGKGVFTGAGFQFFDANGNFTVPNTGPYLIVGTGGGGGGGSGSFGGTGGTGGSGAAAVAIMVNLTKDDVIAVSLGTGGSGGGAQNGSGQDGNNGSQGNSTTFGAYLTAVGGYGGIGGKNDNSAPALPLPGTYQNAGSKIMLARSKGHPGKLPNETNGGVGGNSPWGIGGARNNAPASDQYGAGGGGGDQNGWGYAGGNGAKGALFVAWWR